MLYMLYLHESCDAVERNYKPLNYLIQKLKRRIQAQKNVFIKENLSNK